MKHHLDRHYKRKGSAGEDWGQRRLSLPGEFTPCPPWVPWVTTIWLCEQNTPRLQTGDTIRKSSQYYRHLSGNIHSQQQSIRYFVFSFLVLIFWYAKSLLNWNNLYTLKCNIFPNFTLYLKKRFRGYYQVLSSTWFHDEVIWKPHDVWHNVWLPTDSICFCLSLIPLSLSPPAYQQFAEAKQ